MRDGFVPQEYLPGPPKKLLRPEKMRDMRKISPVIYKDCDP